MPVIEEVISVSEDFYVLSTSSRVDDRVRVLKHGETFAVFDRFGDIERFGNGWLGVYHQDTRCLSRFTLRMRKHRPLVLSSSITPDTVILGYEGLDECIRRTRIAFDPPPGRLTESEGHFQVALKSGDEANYYCAIACEPDGGPRGAHYNTNTGVTARSRTALSFDEAAKCAIDALKRARIEEPEFFTSNEQFNDWVNRSIADLHMLRTKTACGLYPYAGVPWFSTAFGRDGIITALECLWFNPALARGVLSYLAAKQASTENAQQDAEPGKILHETRQGEMAALGEVPFGLYYGSIDATPLFVMLAGAYYERTGDRAFARSIWPNVARALTWIDRYGDRDRDGFVEYARRSHHGLVHQGWKDSHDAIFDADGQPAEGPIALCEVQGYVYAAKLAAAELARGLGDDATAQELVSQAE